MLLNSGLHHGVQKSMPHFLGVCLGFPLMVLLVALGFGTVFTQYGWIKEVLKIAGSVYMLYLAWQIYGSDNRSSSAYNVKRIGFIQAVLFQWVNPKAWLMAISAISIFTVSQNYFYNALLLSMIFLMVCLPCSVAWLVFGAALQRILKQVKHRRIFNAVMAAGLVLSIALIWLD
jgi:threonine/homoserine/homoserine lactone efflux protein